MNALAFLLLTASLPSAWMMDQKALDDYMNTPDPNYQYSFKNEFQVGFLLRVKMYNISMTSQKWLDESEVDKPIWQHVLKIFVPRKRLKGEGEKVCFLHITNRSPLEQMIGGSIFAAKTKTVVAYLDRVPFQPLTFHKHPLGYKNIKENDLLAYSWWRFINDNTTEPHWLLEFPMVKAIVRAMDTITDFVKKKRNINITKFLLAGDSKRGRISALTAAVDSRVVGFVPVSIDFMNFDKTFHHQYRSYCGWSFALKAFYEMNVTRQLDHPRFSLLAWHVDPLEYNERYTNVSKMMIILTRDGLSLPDNTHNYFYQLEGEKYLRINFNKDDPGNYVTLGLTTVYLRHIQESIMENKALQKVSWNTTLTNTTGTIYFYTNYYVQNIYSYHADVPRRDFRLPKGTDWTSKRNIKWIKHFPVEVEYGVYKADMGIPAKGWRAFFLEVIVSLSIGEFQITTEMYIIPDTYPCPDCTGDECHGKLV